MFTCVLPPSPATSLPSFVEVPLNLTPGQQAPLSTLFASGMLNCSAARRRASSGFGRVLVPCPVRRRGSGTAVSPPDPAGLRHPSPACSQGSQKLSSTVCLTGAHSDLQKGLKEKQEDRNLSSFLFLLCPTPCLLSLHVLTKPGKPWKLGWATGKEPGFIGRIPPPEVAE